MVFNHITREKRIINCKSHIYAYLKTFLQTIRIVLLPRAETFARNVYNDLVTYNLVGRTTAAQVMAGLKNYIFMSSGGHIEPNAIADLMIGHAQKYLEQLLEERPEISPEYVAVLIDDAGLRADDFIETIRYDFLNSLEIGQCAKRFARLAFNAMVQFRLVMTVEGLMEMIRDYTEFDSATGRTITGLGDLSVFNHVQRELQAASIKKSEGHHMVNVARNYFVSEDDHDFDQFLPQSRSSPITTRRRRLNSW